jgi:hypothetical protein
MYKNIDHSKANNQSVICFLVNKSFLVAKTILSEELSRF